VDLFLDGLIVSDPLDWKRVPSDDYVAFQPVIPLDAFKRVEQGEALDARVRFGWQLSRWLWVKRGDERNS
jgi:hypothetical protein